MGYHTACGSLPIRATEPESHMTRSTIAIAALMMGVSTLAFAQTPSATPAPGTSPSATSAMPGKTTDTTAPAMQAKPTTADNGTTKTLTEKLTAAGYTDVRTMPDSIIVHAKDKSGSPVSVIMEHGTMTVFTAADAMEADAKPGAGRYFTDIPANEDLSSKLVGLDVYNATNQKIGTIKDIAFGPQGVKAYIVAVGGFLGMGDRFVAIRPAAIKVGYTASDRKWHATMQTTAAELKAAPEYKYATNS